MMIWTGLKLGQSIAKQKSIQHRGRTPKCPPPIFTVTCTLRPTFTR